MAYFVQNFTIVETEFQNIDAHEPRFGAIINKSGKEVAILFIRNGEIYRLKVQDLNRLEKVFDDDPRLKAFSN